MDGNLSGRAAQHAAHPPPPPGHGSMMPGDGPVADYLQRLSLHAQHQNNVVTPTANNPIHGISRPQASTNQSSRANPQSPPKLEQWTITRFDGRSATTPMWRVSRRSNDNLAESQIKAKLDKQRKMFRTPLKLSSSEVTPNQRRQVEDLIVHRNEYDLDQRSEWVFKALEQTKEKDKVTSVHVTIARKKLNNDRKVRPANSQYRWLEVHEVNDPKFRQKQQHANHLNATHVWPQSQQHQEAGFGYHPAFNGHNNAANMQPPVRAPSQMDQMFGQIREGANPRAAAPNASKQPGMGNNFAGSDRQQAGDRAPPKSAPTKAPPSQNLRGQGASKPKPKPKIIQMTDSEGSSQSSFSDCDDASFSGGESAATEYSQHTQHSQKIRNLSPESLRHKSNSRSGKDTARKQSNRGSVPSKHHSRRGERDSTSSEEDSSSGGSFIDHSKANRKAKSHKRRSRETEIRQHYRPVAQDAVLHSSSRRYSHASGGEIRPHRSSMSHKTPSHQRGYSNDSLGSSPKDMTYYPSSRQSIYGSSQHSQRAWELEQKESQLDMEFGMRQRQLEQQAKERSRQLDERELAMFRQLHRRESIMC